MKALIFNFALAVFFAQGSFAQAFGEIHGSVVDENGESIPGVSVSVTDGVNISGDVTDLDGRFKIKPLSPGTYTLRYNFTSLNPVTFENVGVDPDEITFIPEVTMIPLGLGPIVITGITDGLIDPEETSKMTLREADLKNMATLNGGDIKAVVRSISSDFKTDRDGELYFRGSRGGDVLYFVDGVKLYNTAVRVPSSGVASISVYTGGVPAKYGDTVGGVIVVETKNYLSDYYKKLNR